MLRLLLRLWWLQQRRNFRKRDAFVACYIIFLYVVMGVSFFLSFTENGGELGDEDMPALLGAGIVVGMLIPDIIMKMVMKRDITAMDDYVKSRPVPGDPIKLIGGDKALSPEVELQLRVRYHLVQTDDDGNAILDENGDPVQTSLVDRYLYYMNGLLHGDLGNSYQRKLPVTEIFAQKYPYTVKLAACAIVLEAIMGIGAGIISAVKRYSFWDILVTLTTSILVAVPAFWLGMLLQL